MRAIAINTPEMIGLQLFQEYTQPQNQHVLFDKLESQTLDTFQSRRLKLLEKQNPGRIILASEDLINLRLRAMCLGGDIEHDAYMEMQKTSPSEDFLTRRLDEVRPEECIEDIEYHLPTESYVGYQDGFTKILSQDFLQIRTQLIAIAKWEPASLLR